MDKILQSIEITFIGMSVVFIVLALLTLILKIQGWFMSKDQAEEKEEAVSTTKQLTEEPARTSPANPKMAAAITAALTMYNEEKEQTQEK